MPWLNICFSSSAKLIVNSTFVIFLLLFFYEQKKMHGRSREHGSFMCTCSSVTEMKDGLSTCYQF